MNKIEFDSSVVVPPGPAHSVLARGASGLRHLRWAREVLGTLQAFLVEESRLSEAQRVALRAAVEQVSALVAALSGCVKPYRDFLERSRTGARGALRAAAYVAAGGSGLASPPDAEAATQVLAAAQNEWATVVEPRRQALHEALARAIDDTRAGLRAMDERLAVWFPAELVAALYPPLTADCTRVLDEGDADDDATAGPA